MKPMILGAIIIAVLIISATLIVVFSQPTIDMQNDEINPGDDPVEPLGNLSFHDAVNAFAFEVYRELYNTEYKNDFISPYSIFTALAMTYEGAKDTTAAEMAEVLQVEQDNASFHAYMKNLYEVLNRENSEYNLSTANALWIDKRITLLNSYLHLIQTYYGGEATNVDYSKPSEAVATINQWVENRTNNLIKDLVPEGAIDPLTRLILTNAIYFKGTWKFQFDPVNTTNRSFETLDGSTVQTETMVINNTEDNFSYTETDTVQILELPYTGESISMVIILPKDSNDLSSVIDSITYEQLSQWLNALEQRHLDIYLPKFKIETTYSVGDYLKSMGMNQAFTPSADFSGITGGKDLYIDEVIHKAYIDVNEEGTEAAGATAVMMRLTSVQDEPPRVVFDCNHPFLYLIRHRETDTILFMGTIGDPTV